MRADEGSTIRTIVISILTSIHAVWDPSARAAAKEKIIFYIITGTYT